MPSVGSSSNSSFGRNATADVNNRNAVLTFVLRYFPSQFGFITHQLDAFRSSRVTFGVAGTIAVKHR